MLLVSCRNLEEAAIAIHEGVDIVDFKNPDGSGPLAPADAAIWQRAAVRWPEAIFSAALGESEQAIGLVNSVPPMFRFAKVGPSGLTEARGLLRLWRDIVEGLASRQDIGPTELVPVAYADHQAAGSLTCQQVLELVITKTSHHRLLIDTWNKDGRTLVDHLTVDEIRLLLQTAKSAGIWCALAGSVTTSIRDELARHRVIPDCWGVRGDVCVTSSGTSQRRRGTLDPDRVRTWLTAPPNGQAKRSHHADTGD